MKPLGTISMYFNFVDEKTKSILDALMERAYNYFDFANLITERACLDSTPPLLAFMAVLHSSKLWNMHNLNRLSERYSNDPLIRPYLLETKSSLGEEVDWEGVLDATRIVLDSTSDKWIALHMHLLNSSVATGSHRIPLKESTIRTIGNLIQSNKDLSCFSSNYLLNRAAMWNRVEDKDKRLSFTQRAIEAARIADDKLSEGIGYGMLASVYLSTDFQKTKEYIHSSNLIFEELGHRLGLADNLAIQSGIHSGIGEYDKALECLFEAMLQRESLGVNNWIIPTNVAWIYNVIGDHNAALEWSEYALISICMCDNLIGYPHLQRARAMINIGRIEESIEHLDVALRYALKEGDERLMKLYDITLTLLQRAEGGTLSALLNLEEQISSDHTTLDLYDLNEYLLLLAETEVFAFKHDDTNTLSEYSGPWMERLEERARDKEQAGLLGLALLLKARLRLKQNRTEATKYLLEEVQQLGKIYNMEFLYDRATHLGERVGFLDS
ncbi:MAG: hypothetical protein ACXAEF_03245 [Candidatus Thorarchaeota archaeon]|jgi:tetratricopeptide (TPR) repeat protein